MKRRKSGPDTMGAAVAAKLFTGRKRQKVLKLVKVLGSWSFTALSLLVYMATSSWLIICMKKAQDEGFKYSFALTTFGAAASSVAGLGAMALGLGQIKHKPDLTFIVRRVLPIAVCGQLAMGLGQVASLHLTISFVQILKAFTPATVLVVLMLFKLERPSTELYASVTLIVLGTIVSAVAESGLPTWSTWGVVVFMCSCVFEAVRTAMSQSLLQPFGFTAFESLVFTLPLTTLLTLLGSAVLEGREVLTVGLQIVRAHPMLYAQISLMGVLVNSSSNVCLKRVSALTMKVAVCVRNLIVVWYGAAVHRDRVTLVQVVGYLVSVSGFLAFSYARTARLKGTGASKSGKRKVQ